MRRTFWLGAISVLVWGALYAAVWLVKGVSLLAQVAPVAHMLVAGSAAAYVHATGKVRNGARALLCGEYFLFALIGFTQGAVGSPALHWAALVPVVAAVAGEVALSLTFTAAYIVQALVMDHLDQIASPALLAMRPYVLPNPRVDMLVAVIGMATMFFLFGWLTTRWRHQLEDSLDAARASAEQATEAKARLVATISHEIRTPLNGVVTAAELLRRGDLPAGQHEQLVNVLGASSHTLLSLLNDVLDWSKLESGKVALNQQPVHLRALVFEATELYAAQAFGKGLELSSTCDPAVPRALLGDPLRIRQIVNNLVANAVKFTQRGGVHVHLAPESQGAGGNAAAIRRVRIEISDSGLGIAPERMQELFKPFSQISQPGDVPAGGTGLGLTISRELARLMGGDITVKSAPHQGTTFTVHLPLRAAEAEPMQRRGRAGAGLSLAVLTRQHGLRIHVHALAEELGAKVIPSAAPVALTGVLDIESLRADLVLIDAATIKDMPVDALRPGLRELSAAGSHVAVLTPLGAHEDLASQLGVASLAKPVRLTGLRGLLQSIQRSRGKLVQEQDEPSHLSAEQPFSTPHALGTRVLVAEDNPLNQLLVEAILGKLGARITFVGNGLEALQAVQAGGFDMILMDNQMPVLNGMTATARIRELEDREGRPRVPIIATTGDATGDNELAWRAAGADQVVAKPFDLDLLHRVLAHWISTTEAHKAVLPAAATSC